MTRLHNINLRFVRVFGPVLVSGSFLLVASWLFGPGQSAFGPARDRIGGGQGGGVIVALAPCNATFSFVASTPCAGGPGNNCSVFSANDFQWAWFGSEDVLTTAVVGCTGFNVGTAAAPIWCTGPTSEFADPLCDDNW